jgi:hypothetical protein
MTRAAPAVNLFSGIVALAIFAAGVWITTEVARYQPNTLMIEHTPKADKR